MNSVIRKPMRVRYETRRRMVQVVRVETLSPRMKRIVLGGEDLDGFTSAAADDHVKLFFPAPGEDKPVFPDPAGGGAPPIMRDYTPRRFDAAAGELTIEFVLHGDGPASNWATHARPGTWLGVGGPRGSFLVPDDFDAYLLVGDESALPAIARRLEEMPAGVRAIALIEVENAEEERYLPTAANASISWVHRAAGGPGLLAALERLVLPQGDVHAWLAGEIDVMRSLRTHLVAERGLVRDHVRAAGYWRLGSADAHDRIED